MTQICRGGVHRMRSKDQIQHVLLRWRAYRFGNRVKPQWKRKLQRAKPKIKREQNRRILQWNTPVYYDWAKRCKERKQTESKCHFTGVILHVIMIDHDIQQVNRYELLEDVSAISQGVTFGDDWSEVSPKKDYGSGEGKMIPGVTRHHPRSHSFIHLGNNRRGRGGAQNRGRNSQNQRNPPRNGPKTPSLTLNDFMPGMSRRL